MADKTPDPKPAKPAELDPAVDPVPQEDLEPPKIVDAPAGIGVPDAIKELVANPDKAMEIVGPLFEKFMAEAEAEKAATTKYRVELAQSMANITRGLQVVDKNTRSIYTMLKILIKRKAGLIIEEEQEG